MRDVCGEWVGVGELRVGRGGGGGGAGLSSRYFYQLFFYFYDCEYKYLVGATPPRVFHRSFIILRLSILVLRILKLCM